jgi:hypothetical protein
LPDGAEYTTGAACFRSAAIGADGGFDRVYPDPLLAPILTASTFSDQIPDTDGWARAHSYLTGDALARAINEDNLPWDPSVIALLPLPAVLDRMRGTESGPKISAMRCWPTAGP